MALEVLKETDLGIKAGYWRIEMITLNFNKEFNEVNFSLNLYLNSNAKQFIESINYTELMGNQNPELLKSFMNKLKNKDIRQVCYEFAKENIAFFKNAKNI